MGTGKLPPLNIHEQGRQIAGAVILAITAVAYLGIGSLNIGAPAQPRPRILLDNPSQLGAAKQWREFVCSRDGEAVHYFRQARAEFIGRSGGQAHWRVFTPESNTPEKALNIDVNPNTVVCGYVNK